LREMYWKATVLFQPLIYILLEYRDLLSFSQTRSHLHPYFFSS
jgi:hypothetical protein